MAVSFDASGGGATAVANPLNWSHTCATGTVLFVGVSCSNSGTSVTYNGVAMTQIFTTGLFLGVFSIFYLSNPSSGTNTVAVSTGNFNTAGQSMSFKTTNTTQPDGTGTGNVSAEVATASANASQAGDFVACFCGTPGSTAGSFSITTGGSTTIGTQTGTGAPAYCIGCGYLNSATSGSGSQTISISWGGPGNSGTLYVFTVQPAPTTSISSVSGIPFASIKVVEGVAIANVSSVGGIP